MSNDPNNPNGDYRNGYSRLDERTSNLIRRFEDLALRWEKRSDDHEDRIRKVEENQVRYAAVIAAIVVGATAGWPFIKAVFHIAGN